MRSGVPLSAVSSLPLPTPHSPLATRHSSLPPRFPRQLPFAESIAVDGAADVTRARLTTPGKGQRAAEPAGLPTAEEACAGIEVHEPQYRLARRLIHHRHVAGAIVQLEERN